MTFISSDWRKCLKLHTLSVAVTESCCMLTLITMIETGYQELDEKRFQMSTTWKANTLHIDSVLAKAWMLE